jgi:poly(3-hydroxybutyrate) depolymerase
MGKQFLLLVILSMLSYQVQKKETDKDNASPTMQKVELNNSWYWLGVPESKNKNLPVIVALHGDEGHPDNMKRFWEKLWKEKQDFIFVAPECPRGICNKGGVNTWSKGGYDGSEPQGEWLKSVIDEVLANHPADSKRVFAVGYSGGAIFLGYQGFKMFQDVFAGIQWSCGGVNETEAQVYKAPQDSNCKVPGRIVISRNGDVSYLVTAADRIMEILKNNGHKNEFYDTGCDGHCCDANKYSENTYNWFMSLPSLCEN